ncbi:MAG TPA: Lrp/AsnC family transcriptional regulator [Candidatus Nanoarchaeia archaeon]|nr:Lrp/AsnC family transcriptional regulator [Candidatus Nanoarchaeia archaeon]
MVKIDRTLLYLQSENARMSLKELSRHLRKSPQRLKYAVSILEKEGVIRQPYCIFDYSYFGLILFRVYFKGGYISEQEKAKVVRELEGNPFVLSIYELTGEFDLAVEFAAPNPSKFNKELKKIANANTRLNDYKIVLNLVTYVYPRQYLVSQPDLYGFKAERIIGGDRERESFTPHEMAVMRQVLQSPRLRFRQLAERAAINVKTAKSVLDGLTRRSIIRGFRYVLDMNAVGITRSRLFLKLHNVSLERENQLMQYMKGAAEIIQVNKTVGDWDMEVDIESLSKSRVRSIILQLREEFKDLIERFNLIEIYQYYKQSYLPAYLFQEEKG